jgi:hypothetical protein
MSGPACNTVDSLSTSLNSGVFSSEELIFLVSECGKKFVLNAELAKSSSEYFAGLLQAGMIETGKPLNSLSRIPHEKIQKGQSTSVSDVFESFLTIC